MTKTAASHTSAWKRLPGRAFLLYAIVFAACLPFYWYAVAPDLISYISIARHYAHGQWAEAVNTYWSPAFSWLIALFLWMHAPELLAAHLASAVSGLLALAAAAYAAARFEINERWREPVLYTAAVLSAAFGLLQPGPDLLLAAILLTYFSLVLRADCIFNPKYAGYCGMLGAAAFLTKTFGFVFFAAHFLLMVIAYALKYFKQLRTVVRWSATALVVFALLSAPWIAAVSKRSGALSIGSAGTWNYRLVGPQSVGYPQYRHLFPPPTPGGISMWDEPPITEPSWNIWVSAANIHHEAVLIVSNLKAYIGFLQTASVFSFAILLAYLILPSNIRRSPIPPLYLIAVFIVLPGAYVLVTIQERYVWVLFYLLLLMAGIIVQAIEPALTRKAALALALWGSFLVIPAAGLLSHRNSGKALHQIAVELSTIDGMHGRIAACGEWNNSLAIAYFGGNPFYGSTSATAQEETASPWSNPDLRPVNTPVYEQLRQFKIDYYLVWPTCKPVDASVISSPEITQGHIPNLRVYRITNAH